jgi:4-alpha-glucanotransferase
MFDRVRIDHFRGLESFWAIPYGEKTAVEGEWMPAMGDELFGLLRDQLGNLPIVAEDLGTITEEVHALRKKYGFPGMKVLQFAFDNGSDNEYLPHNYETDFVVYTGTHDNNTTRGWWKSLTSEERRRVLPYLSNPKEVKHWQFIGLALSSVAETAIIPFQDVLGLGERARMNTPGTVEGNWVWRFTKGELHRSHGEKLLKLTRLYAR